MTCRAVSSRTYPFCGTLKGDLSDPEFVASLWTDHGHYDNVYHLGAYAAEGLSHFIRDQLPTNLVASVHLINEAIKAKAPVSCSPRRSRSTAKPTADDED